MSLPDDSNPPAVTPLWQRRWAGPAVITAAFVAMLVWTWQTWADLLVDFGVQLYVPWQLSQGKVLYRDIAHYTGPMSVYYNALAFRIFGANLRVLELANLPVLIGIVIAIYYLALRLGGRLCAAICGLSFVTLFAFAHLTIAGNYNYVCPYEYEYTHATLLCLICIIFLWRLVRERRIADAIIAGFLAGMIFLTRSEFFVAIVGAGLAGMVLFAATSRSIARVAIASIGFVLAAALPAVISAGLLRPAMPWPVAIRGVLGMWPSIFTGHVTAQHFYLHSMGLDDLHRSLLLLAAWVAAYAIPIAGFLAWAMIHKLKPATPHLIAAFLIGVILTGWQWQHREWVSLFRPLPIVAVGVTAVSMTQFWRHRREADPKSCAALAAMLGIFALLLLGKVFFYARIIHYGCWLAMPAAMLLLIALFGWIPKAVRRHGGSAALFLSGIGGVWAVVLLVHLAMTAAATKRLTTSVGTGPDQFWADASRADVVNSAILAAEQIIPGNKTLACFPEGIMINYLSRRQTATPYVNFNPPDLLLFGEDQMVAAMNATPPDYIFLVHKDTSEFGERFFGRDYGRKLFAWIDENYVEQPLPMLDLGAEPLRGNRFGIRLLIPRSSLEGQRRVVYGTGAAGPVDSTAAASTSSRE
ncbi:MAG TPA: hypothetical protein VHX86_15335 [Tepidisphaeraceae bacterium]|jgi:hypothetical protein|nr:hypothetical protein [Tepidisphaeraceae bacterium]